MKKILLPILVLILSACAVSTPAPIPPLPMGEATEVRATFTPAPTATFAPPTAEALAPGLYQNGSEFTLHLADGTEVTLGEQDVVFDKDGKWRGVSGYELKDGKWVVAPEVVAPAENIYMKSTMILDAKDYSKAPEIDPNNKEQMKQISEAVMARYNAGEFNQIDPNAVPFQLDYTQEIYGADGMMQILSPKNMKNYQNPKLDPQISGPIFRDINGNALIAMFMKQGNGEVGLTWDYKGKNGITVSKWTVDFKTFLNYMTTSSNTDIKLPINFENSKACIKYNRGDKSYCEMYDLNQDDLIKLYAEWKQTGLIPNEFKNGKYVLQYRGRKR